MESFISFLKDAFDVFESHATALGLFVTAYAIWLDVKERRVSNYLTIKAQFHEIWKHRVERPELARLEMKDVDLIGTPITDLERQHVKMRIMQLDAVRRTMKYGVFVRIQGLRKDIQDFFANPIPKILWEEFKPWQDEDFVIFVEDCMASVD